MSSTYNDFKKDNRLKLFGHEDAEKEDASRLEAYYYKTQSYEDVVSDLRFQIVIGEKGTGKSAVLKIAFSVFEDSGFIPLWIRQDDVVELYQGVNESRVVSELKVLWKKSLGRLIAMKIVDGLKLVHSDDAMKAMEWAYNHGYSSRDFISRLAKELKPLYENYVDLDQKPEAEIGEHHVLNRLMKKKKVILFLDDFDLDWKGELKDIQMIKSLILALSDLTSDIEGLYARIAIRTDVYEMIRTQEFSDKIESSIIKCTWNNQEIMMALAKRICAYYRIDFQINESEQIQYQLVKYLNEVFEPYFDNSTRVWSKAPTHRVIYSLIRRKPRDMVKLCLAVSEKAYTAKKNKIDAKCFLEILDSYSQERMKDLVNEYSRQMTNLKNLLMRMAPTKREMQNKLTERYVFKTAELYEKIKNIQGNINVEIFNPEGENKKRASFHEIAHFLYRIGFITGRTRTSTNKIRRVFYDDIPELLEQNIGDRGYSWEIHPAYRAAISNGIDDTWKSTLDVEDEE